MPKMLVKVQYTAEGLRGLQKDGGTARRKTVTALIEASGGRVECFYFAYGEEDAFVVIDVPDAAAGLALGLAVSASGAARVSSIPLITPEEMDTACKRTVAYRPPGA